MRKKIVILLLIVAIFYIVVGALLLLNIQLMESPDILVEIEVTEINSEKAVLHTIINVGNPNSFDIIARNLEIVTTTPDGYEVANVFIEGGKIGSNENQTFTEDVEIAFNGHSPEHLISKISGDVGANILFIEKTIPLKVGIVTSIENLINDLAAPIISATINIDDITTDNIDISAEITAYNPNAIDMYLTNISAEIETDSGEKVGSLEVANGVITGLQYTDLEANGSLLLKAFNAKKLFINIEGMAGANVAGFEKNLPLDITVIVNIPDLEEILLPKENPTVLSIKVDGKLTIKGFLTNAGLIVNNTFKVDLVLRNTTIKLFAVHGYDEQLLGEANIEEEIVIEAGSVKNVSCEIIVPLTKILSSKILSADYQMISVSAYLTVRGIDPAVYLEIRGYQDMHLIR
jgi:LEA14-like dessication related protein